MKKFLVAIAAAGALLAACSDDTTQTDTNTEVAVDEATAVPADISEALQNAQQQLTPQLASTIGVAEEDINVAFTANTEQEPPAAIATVILLTTEEVAEEKITAAVDMIQQKLESIDGITVNEKNIMITNPEGDVLH